MRTVISLIAAMIAGGLSSISAADEPTPAYDAQLASKLGADEHGMRQYVLVILKTGPTPMPRGKQRDEMFKGHFANIQRLASEGKLALAGPFEDKNDWRGMFVFAVEDVETAKQLVATDPVVIEGEMVPEFHKYYGSAALMLVNEFHEKVQKQGF